MSLAQVQRLRDCASGQVIVQDRRDVRQPVAQSLVERLERRVGGVYQAFGDLLGIRRGVHQRQCVRCRGGVVGVLRLEQLRQVGDEGLSAS
jgi:hypothetical protein